MPEPDLFIYGFIVCMLLWIGAVIESPFRKRKKELTPKVFINTIFQASHNIKLQTYNIWIAW